MSYKHNEMVAERATHSRLQTLAHSDPSVLSSSPLSRIDSLPLFGMDDSIHFLWSPPK